MSLFIPKPKPLYSPMLSTFGGGSVQGFKTGATAPSLPTPTLLHLEDAGTNFSSLTWTATVGPNVSFSGAFSTPTDSDGNSYLLFATDGNNDSYGSVNITLPSNMCIMSVIDEEDGGPIIIEHSTDANSNNGMYHYSDTGFSYGVRRSGTFAGYDPEQADGTGTEDPVSANTKTIWGSNLQSTNSLTDVFYSSKFGGKRNAVLSNGSAISHGNTNKDLYIGSRASSSIFFTGKLYELYMTAALSQSDWDDAIAYFEDKFNL